MRLAKNLIFSLAILSFSCTNVSAMYILLENSSRHLVKKKASCSVSKRFLSNTLDFERNMKKSENKILETPIVPKNKPKSYNLPANFFIEHREDITLDKVNERIFHVHREIDMEKESSINSDEQSENKKDKQFALFKKENGNIIDRRIRVDDPLNSQYLPICYLRGSYKLSDTDTLFYKGSGFRNSLNQVVTAGHNLFIDEESVEKYFKHKKMPLPQKSFSFDNKLLTMYVIFGYRNEKGGLKYVHLSEVNGRHCFIHDVRDLGIIQLPSSQKKLLDNDIGSLPTMFFPDQPHEYIDKNITIVGYPGEIQEPSLYSHSGPIKNADPGKIVFYDIDTTKGNSGSPGLDGVANSNDIRSVFLTHTHNEKKSLLNAGQGYDQDFYDFMFSISKLGTENFLSINLRKF